MVNERRKYKRVKNKFQIRIKSENVNGARADFEETFSARSVHDFRTGSVVDISARGVLFNYNKQLELGSIISIRFIKPNTFDFFDGYARVVRIEINPDNTTFDIGVELMNLSQEEEKSLNYYLTWR